MKNFLRSASLRATDKAKAEEQPAAMPVLAIHIHPVMALKARLPKLRALKGTALKVKAPKV